MKRTRRLITGILIISSLLLPVAVYAREGDSGYEGGVSSGEAPGKTSYDYQEVCFITGEPIVFKGTLVIKKSFKEKENSITATYTYNLKNIDKAATLTRVLSYNTKLVKKENGQTIEETTLSKQPTEIIRVNSIPYILKSCDFTRSGLIDTKPAINYFAGNTWGKKVYQAGAASSGGTVSVEATGEFYGYDQYWGTAEVEKFSYIIQSQQKNENGVDSWGGTANVSLSSSTTQMLKFIENEPRQISFNGGYMQTQYNNNILEYSCRLPEFDANGISTDNLKSLNNSLKIETFPIQKRLPVPNIRHLRGHWAEDDIRILYSLEVFKGNDTLFNPEQLITRAEFATAIMQAAKEVPLDPVLISRTRSSNVRSKTKQVIVSPFSDVSIDNVYFTQIDNAFKRGIIMGKGNKFVPNEALSVADAITIFVRALGLEDLAPSPNAVTAFRDNDKIPAYARNAVYVAEKIGLVEGDERGYIKPDKSMTKAEAAELLNRFISYMCDGIKKDYRERIVNYN